MSFSPVKEFNINQTEYPQLYNALQNINSEKEFMELLNKNHEILGIFLSSLSPEVVQSKSAQVEKAFSLVTSNDQEKWSPDTMNRVKKAQINLDLKKSITKLIKDNETKSVHGQEDQLRQFIVKKAVEYLPTFSINETMEKSLQLAKEIANQNKKIRPTKLEVSNLMEILVNQIPDNLIAIRNKAEKERNEDAETEDEGVHDYYDGAGSDFEIEYYSGSDTELDSDLADDLADSPEITEETVEKDSEQLKTEFDLLTSSLKSAIAQNPVLASKLENMIKTKLDNISEILKEIAREDFEEIPGKALTVEENLKIFQQILSKFGIDAKNNPEISPKIESFKNNVKTLLEKVYLPTVKRFYLGDSEFTPASGEQFRQINSLLKYMNNNLAENWGVGSEIDGIKPRVYELIQQLDENKIGVILDSDNYEKLHQKAISAIPVLNGFINNDDDTTQEFVDALRTVVDNFGPYKKMIEKPDDLIFDSILLHVRSLIVEANQKLENRLGNMQVNLADPGNADLKRRIESMLGDIQKVLGTEIKLEMKMATERDVLITLLYSTFMDNKPTALEDARKWVENHEKDYDLDAFESWLAAKNMGVRDIADIDDLYAHFIAETS